jgi:hypothetical protein
MWYTHQGIISNGTEEEEMEHVLPRAAFALLLAGCLVALGACDQGGDVSETDTSTTTDTVSDTSSDVTPDTTPDTEPDTETEPTCTASVSGTVSRLVETCPPLFGGIGPLCVHVLATCTDPSSEVASVIVPDANMSYPTNTVDYTVTGVPPGTWQVYAYHDDDESGCDFTLTTGDFFSGDGCISVTVDGSCTDVTDADIVFNNKQT